jgi:hypothetical protein
LKVNSKPKIEIVVFKFEFIEQGSGKIIINWLLKVTLNVDLG